MAKYVQFTRAANDLKRYIIDIGGKNYTISDQWLNQPHHYPSYSENSLQAIWNITETLLAATRAFSSTYHLVTNYSSLEKWFRYIQPGTGTLQITDEKTYALGKVWKEFLGITTTDPEAMSMLTGPGVTRLQGVLDGINERLKKYEAHRTAEHALINYEQKINTFISAQTAPPLPAFINNNNGTLSYHIDASTLDDQKQRHDADRQSFEILIDQLKTLLHQLAAQINKLADQHEDFNNTHPFPREATVFQDRLLAIRETACVQLLNRHKEIKTMHLQVNELLSKAKNAEQDILKAIKQGAEPDRMTNIERATQAEESADLQAKASLSKYLLEKAALEEMPTTSQQAFADQQTLLSLSELQSRQDNLACRQAILNRLLTQLEFSIANTQPLKDALLKQLAELKAMEPDAALESLDENIEQLKQLAEWFKDRPPGEQLSYEDLNTSIRLSFSAQGEEWGVLRTLYAEINTAISADMLAKKALLQQEHETLGHRVSTVNGHFHALHQLTDEYTAQKEVVQLQKLTAIVKINKMNLEKMDHADKLSKALKNQLITDLKQQLRYLSHQDTFFATIASSNHPGITEKFTQISADRDALSRFMTALHASVQPQVGALQQTNLYRLQLERAFFGPTKNKIGGAFGDYLRERASTFWIQDFWGRLASVVLGSFSYQSDAEARKEYITNLRAQVIKYQTDPDAYDGIITLVERGKRDFKSRTMVGDDYNRSLHAKLSAFQKNLILVNDYSANEVAEETISLDHG